VLPPRAPVPVRMAIRGTTASLSRTGVSVSALAVSVATVIGVGLMVSSFRGSVDDWLGQSLVADFYLAVDEAWCRGAGGVEPLVQSLRGLPAADEVTFSLRRRLQVGGEEWRLWAVDAGRKGLGAEILAGDPATARARFQAGEAVLVSEPWAMRRGTRVGDLLVAADAVRRADFPGGRRVPGLHFGPRRHRVASRALPGAVGRRMQRGHRRELRARHGHGRGAHGDRGRAAARQRHLAVQQRRAARGVAGSVRSHLHHHPRAAGAGGAGRLSRHSLGAAGAAAGARRETAVLRAVGWLPRQLRALVSRKPGCSGWPPACSPCRWASRWPGCWCSSSTGAPSAGR
jgi:putative ABC transport system permease protein